MQKQSYTCVCHGCGTVHTVQANFLGSPLSISFKFLDGTRRDYPAHNCGGCSPETIRKAFFEGSSLEARRRACETLGAISP